MDNRPTIPANQLSDGVSALSRLRFLRLCRKRAPIEQYRERIIDLQDKQGCSRPVLEVKKECGQCEIEPNGREY